MVKDILDTIAEGKYSIATASLREAFKNELTEVLQSYTEDDLIYIMGKSRELTDRVYGRDVYIRGLTEFTNYCRNDCFYCGIRCSNKSVQRYRLSPEEILECCERGYALGMRTFVLQGGEDLFYKDEVYVDLISQIKNKCPNCAVTLSIGEKPEESYRKYREAGADRFLLRHETATKEHYKMLHPDTMSFDNRMECLKNLHSLGYQTGCGLMVGSPYQTKANLAEDLLFMYEFKPEMIGIGPFIPCSETPFKDFTQGSVNDTLMLIALTRLLIPNGLIPATTALGSASGDGWASGLYAGCNVVMINISPKDDRAKYNLYDNKSVTASDDVESLEAIRKSIESCGYNFCLTRGDYKSEQR